MNGRIMDSQPATTTDADGRARGGADGTPGPVRTSGAAGFGLVEALIAFVILAVGLLAVAGIALSVAAQTRGAASTTAQSLAGQQVLEVTATSDYGDVPVGEKDTTVTVGNRSYTITRVVEQPSVGTKKVTVQIPGDSEQSSDVMITYIHQQSSAPPPPGS
ncbi:MAG: type IV pilus modification PilV family protein [Gemmatimonadota bacterium]